MQDYPIEQREREEETACIVCGNSTSGSFCSRQCAREYASSIKPTSRKPMSEAQRDSLEQKLSRIEETMHNLSVTRPEGVELDIAIDTLRENRTARAWACDQAQKLHRDFGRR